MVPPVIDAPFPPGPCSGNLYRHRRQVMTSRVRWVQPRPVRPTIGTVLYHMLHPHVLHPMSGCHASAGEAMAARLAGWFGLARFPVGFGLEAGMRSRPVSPDLPVRQSPAPTAQSSATGTVARSWTMMAMRASRSAVLSEFPCLVYDTTTATRASVPETQTSPNSTHQL